MIRSVRRTKCLHWMLIALSLWTFCGGPLYAQLSQNPIPDKPFPVNRQAPPALDKVEFDEILKELQGTIDPEIAGKKEKAGEKASKRAIDMVKVLDCKKRLLEEDKKIREYFKDLGEFLKAKGLSEVIMERHQKAVQDYEAKCQTLFKCIDDIEVSQAVPDGFWERMLHRLKVATAGTVDRNQAVTDAVQFLEANTPKPKKSHFDPHNLPHRSLKPPKNPILPKLTPEEWKKAYPQQSSNRDDQSSNFQEDDMSLASILSTIGDLLVPSAAADILPEDPDQPTPEDLAETIEVQFTPEITQLAADLENNPVKIYNWVRNNIDFVPTWGSIQGAQLCLENRAGNAFDTASLLITLLRVSGIPARYQMGTIEVPIDQFMNWAGGFTDPSAAASFFASSGIPITIVKTSDGTNDSIMLEHVWVVAFVDYIPSFGSIQESGDSWIPMDPSFKQFVHAIGLDFYSLLAIDGTDFMNDYLQDPNEHSPYQEYGKRISNLLNTQFEDLTVEDYFGAAGIDSVKQIIFQEIPIIPSSLPYMVVSKSDPMVEMPLSLRHNVSFQIFLPGTITSVLEYTTSLAEIGNSRLTVSYEPASSMDEDLVTEFGGIFEVPPYLLRVKPVIKKDGLSITSGNDLGFGTIQDFRIIFNSPNLTSDVDIIENQIEAGSHSAIIIQHQKPHQNLLAREQNRLLENSMILDSGGDVPLDNLLGAKLNTIGYSYFLNLDNDNTFYAHTFQMEFYRLPSAAVVTAGIDAKYSLFGAPQEVSEGSVKIDVDRNLMIALSTSGDVNRRKDFGLLSGLSSSFFEHKVLETSYQIPAVSSVKLLKLASIQDIPIYNITQSNLSQILPNLIHSSQVTEEIQDAVNAGMIVTVPERDVGLGSWNGTGYIILDPRDGSGAYQITGGISGGECVDNIEVRQNALYVGRQVRAARRREVLAFARLLLGTPYSYGDKDPLNEIADGVACRNQGGQPVNGIDCSGLVAFAHYHAGINFFIGKSAKQQFDYVQNVLNGIVRDRNQVSIREGDLVFFNSNSDNNGDGEIDSDDGIVHIGIMVDVETNEFIHAACSTGVATTDLDTNSYWNARFEAFGIVIP